MVLGYEDGQVHVYDYSRFRTENYKKLVFNVKGRAAQDENGGAEERFCDSKIIHGDSVVAIEMKPGNGSRQLFTASRDGSLVIWEFAAPDRVINPSMYHDGVLQFVKQFDSVALRGPETTSSTVHTIT
jgi:WD40 repeat protein